MIEHGKESLERLVKGGLFIAFEGIHGCGKSTQIRALVWRLEYLGYKPKVTKEVEGTPIADKINAIAFEEGAEPFKNPLIMTLLLSASRLSRVNNIIKPSLEQGKIVIADRAEDSMWVYQHRCEGVDESLVVQLNDLVTQGIHPHVTFLLDIPPEEGFLRRKRRAAETDLVGWDAKTEGFHTKSREAYLQLAKENPSWIILDGLEEEENLAAQVYYHLERYLKHA